MCMPSGAWGNVLQFFKDAGHAIADFASRAGQAINQSVQNAGGWVHVGMEGAKLGAAAASTIQSVNAQKQAGKAQQAQNEYQARMAEENAKIARQNAAMERQQGIEEARLQRIKVAQAIGSQKTAMAANGVDITEGTALDVIEDTAAMGELDALQTRANYERKALAFDAQGYNYSNQANLDRIAGQNAYSAGNYNALSTGLAGIERTMDVASKWYSGSGASSGLKINSGFKNRMAMNTVI